ncbi:ligase-associated DNA damage response endonuclease PdeM [Salinarimonas rosea]|uniref:ligase-associated DNA damage response endonuclease PdeM n=1 Tax=Salinarimonas rosea TaxID=552063 RepID=UPI001FD89F49|nr:ligase-associated DNA damage response endonuclease PdeM [Salinarimonas rosea]
MAETALGRLALVLDRDGVAWLPDHRTLLVADLHLEKGSSRARRGFLLPPYDTRETLSRLAARVAAHDPARVIALGDSFHDRDGPARLDADARAALAALQAGRDWLWLTGNHDPALPATLGGEVADAIVLDGVALRHEPRGEDAAEAEICGHLHPVAKVRLRGRAVRSRCFVHDATRLVMPAFGAYAGGLNVCDAAFAPLFPGGFTAHVAGRERLYAVPSRALCGD